MAKAPTKTTAAIPAAGRTVTAKDNQPPLEEQLRVKHARIFDRLAVWLPKAQKAAKKLDPKTLADVEKLDALFIEGRDIANDADTVREQEKREPFEICKKIDGVFNGGVRDVVGIDPKKAGLAEQIRKAAATKRLEITRAEQAAQEAEANRVREEAQRLEQRASEVAAGGDIKVAEVIANQAEAVHQSADKLGAQAAAPVAQASRAFVGSSGVRVNVDAKLVCTGVNRAEIDLEALRPYIRLDALVAAVAESMKAGNPAPKGAVCEEQAKSRFGR